MISIFEIFLFTDEDPEYKKSGIPQPIHKFLMAKFAADSGSASGASGMDETSVSDDDIVETSASGEAGSASQKKDEVNVTASGSGQAAAAPATSAPTAGAAEIGSGSGSLAEGNFACVLRNLLKNGSLTFYLLKLELSIVAQSTIPDNKSVHIWHRRSHRLSIKYITLFVHSFLF